MPSWAERVYYLLNLVWFVGTLVLILWHTWNSVAYLRRHPLVNGIPLDWPPIGISLFSRRWFELRVQAYSQQQADLELEHFRQDNLRHRRYVELWIFGGLVLVVGMLAFLIATELVR